MKKILFASLIAAAFAAPAAHAEGPAYAGFALGAGGGDFTLSDGFSTIKSTNSPVPFNAYVGYAFHPNFAVEGGLTYFGEYRFDAPPKATVGAFHLGIKGSLPLAQNWLLTGKIGVARHGVSVDVPAGAGTLEYNAHAVRPMFGVGMEYRFTDRFSATLDLNDYGTSKEPELQLAIRNLELGIKYRF